MRLGGPVFGDASTPESWLEALQRHGYGAAYCPLDHNAADDVVSAYVDAAARAHVTIAEVGAWSNPMGPDAEARKKAIEYCQAQLALADRVGARCCVNISGSRGEPWDGPHPDNLTEATFDLIVETTRAIVDAVKPSRSWYTLETMPWMYPDSIESYERLIKAIDRDRFAVHFDPVNLVCSPQRYFGNGAMIREFVARLGNHIRSCHAKDIALATRLTTHLDEVRPGLGGLDYAAYLQSIDRLDPDVPLMLEHLKEEQEYADAAAHLRNVARSEGLAFR